MKFYPIAVGSLCLIGVSLAQEVGSPPSRQGAPRVNITPPVDAKEVELIEREKAAARELNEDVLRSVVSEHFDHLSQLGDSRLDAMRQHVVLLESELKARKAMKGPIVESEILRLKLEAKSVAFRPVHATVLRSAAIPKRPAAAEMP